MATSTKYTSDVGLYVSLMDLREEMTLLQRKVDANGLRNMSLTKEIMELGKSIEENRKESQRRLDMQAQTIAYMYDHLYILKSFALEVITIPMACQR